MGTTATVQTTYADGQEVLATDLDSQANAASNFAGEAIAAIAGVESANSNDTPLTVSSTGSMILSVGGANEKALLLGVLCDYLPATNVTVSGAAGQDRYDSLIAQPQQQNINPFSSNFLSNSGVVSVGTAYQQASGAIYQVLAGTPGAGPGSAPAAPGGWVQIATIYVPANSTSVPSGNITIVLPTLAARIAAYSGTGSTVSSLNTLSGALNLESTDGSINVTPVGGNAINLTVANPAGGSTGSTSSIAALAGIAFFSKYFNYGTQTSSPLPSSSDGLSPVASILGGCNVTATQYTGSGTTMEAHFKLKVKTGAGAQTIGGRFNSNARTQWISLDGTQFYTAALVTTSQTWSTTVPDDGATHTLIFHFNLSFSDGQFNGEIGPWLPQSSTGGIDPAKFALAGPGY